MKEKNRTFNIVKPLLSLSKSVLILCVVLLACNGEVTKSIEAKPKAFGKYNEIVVVADDVVWDGMVGDSFKYYFASAYPIMPSPEPIFDLRHFTTEELYAEPLRKQLRTYVILADLSDFESPTTRMVTKDLGDNQAGEAMKNPEVNSTVGKNKWANGQVLIYLFGNSPESVANSITQNFPAATKRVHEHDARMLKQMTYARELNLGYQAKIQDFFNIDLEIPADFKQVLLVEEDPLLWLRKDTKDAIMNLVFMKMPYKDTDQFTKKEIVAAINDYGEKYVDGDKANDKMVINEEDLPIYEYAAQVDGQYSVELRGLWEMTQSFVGGPFVVNLITSKDGKDVILALSYVYAPGTDKRDLIQQLDFMIKNIEL